MLPSMRLLILLFFAAAILNVTNYLFCAVYHHPSNKPMERQLWPPRHRHRWSPGELICEDTSANNATESNDLNQTSTQKLLCPEVPENVDLEVTKKSILSTLVHNVSSDIDIGGAWKPSTCIARQTVAIIVPFSGNKTYLGTFLHYMHPFLLKQQLDYQIFVVEQSNTVDEPFNRGKLLNVAFVEAQRFRSNGWQCIIIHEPHFLPLYTQNLYRCSWYPKQLAVHVERINMTSYCPQFGGAVALRTEHFLKVNGFSNMYWGIDGDYKDLYNRLLSANFSIERSTSSIGKYAILGGYDGPFVSNKKIYQTASPYQSEDGLSSLSYKLDPLELKPLYTNIRVTIYESTETNSGELASGLIAKERLVFNP